MSSILKALNKVEQEQNGHRPKTLLTQNTASHSSAGRIFMYGLLAVIIAGGGIYAMTHRSPDKAEQAKAPAALQTAGSPAPATAPPSAPVTPTPSPRQLDTPAQRTVIKTTTAQKAATPALPVIAAKPAAKPVTTVQPNQAAQQAPSLPLRSAPKPSESSVAQSSPPRLEVNGIAFQGENGDSIAIVNGVPVSRHSAIEGATVQDIRADRVIFRQGGKTFEVELGKTSGQ